MNILVLQILIVQGVRRFRESSGDWWEVGRARRAMEAIVVAEICRLERCMFKDNCRIEKG